MIFLFDDAMAEKYEKQDYTNVSKGKDRIYTRDLWEDFLRSDAYFNSSTQVNKKDFYNWVIMMFPVTNTNRGKIVHGLKRKCV